MTKEEALNEIRKFCDLDEEKIKALEGFISLLLQENQNFNFIGKSTIDDIWNRHVLDSAQLMKYIDNKNAKFADFGSGAGFPGVVISILGVNEINLIEKSFRKSDFLHRAKLFSKNKIFIHKKNLEDVTDLTFDCIVSRAFAPLPELLDYSKKFLKNGGYCLFLKGKNLQNELELAKSKFKFDFTLHPSLTSSESNIIKIFNLC